MALRVSDEDFIHACKNSASTSEVLEKTGLSDPSNFRKRRLAIERRYGIDLPRYEATGAPPPESSSKEADLMRDISGLRAENKTLRRSQAGINEYKELIHGLVEAEREPPEWLTVPKQKNVLHGVPTLHLSDLHWDEIVYPSQVNNVNEYYREIAIQRLRKVIDTSVFLCKEVLVPAKWEGIVMPLGGDMLSGYIHEELRENKSDSLFGGVMSLLDHIGEAIRIMHKEFGRVFLPCVTGNHGRLDRKPRAKFGVQDNVDWLLYHMLKREFRDNPDVQFLIPDSSDAMYKVYGVRYLHTHGNQFKGGSGISGPFMPWMRGDDKKRKKQVAINQPYDTMLFGHWHMLVWGPNNSWFCNGSLKGYDEYAFNNNYGFERPKQALWFTHPEHGITHKMDVFADESSEKQATNWLSVLK